MNKKKLFDLINDEILDLEIKDSKSEIIIDKTKELTARLYEKGVTFQRFKPGDDVYVIERDENDKAVDYSGYMCIAVSENAVVENLLFLSTTSCFMKKPITEKRLFFHKSDMKNRLFFGKKSCILEVYPL